MVSQFMVELQGLSAVDGEDRHRVLHFNPRLPGDWSGRPVIEQNTCYRMNWGVPHHCDGWRSRLDEETGWGPLQLVICLMKSPYQILLIWMPLGALIEWMSPTADDLVFHFPQKRAECWRICRDCWRLHGRGSCTSSELERLNC